MSYKNESRYSVEMQAFQGLLDSKSCYGRGEKFGYWLVELSNGEITKTPVMCFESQISKSFCIPVIDFCILKEYDPKYYAFTLTDKIKLGMV